MENPLGNRCSVVLSCDFVTFLSISFCSSSLMSLLRKKKGVNSDIPLVEKDAVAKDPGKNASVCHVRLCISASSAVL